MAAKPIKEHIQSLNLGRKYVLFEIDATEWGQGYLRFYAGDEGGSSVSFAGQVFQPMPLNSEGWSKGVVGALPRPTFTIINNRGILTPIVRASDGFKTAPFRRLETYEIYMDYLPNGDPNPDADGTQHNPIEYYEINRISFEGDRDGVDVIQWELITPIDRPNAKIPRVVIVREHCQHSYRTWDPDAGAFNYAQVTCPYTAAASFDVDGNPVSPQDDVCGQFLRSCKDRFGENAVLPALLFPGVERVKLK